jgi:hypothetical protein
MSQEPDTNIGHICANCRPKPNPEFAQLPPTAFLGKHCQIAFPQPEMTSKMYELMWVRVESAHDEFCVGTLDNDPIRALYIKNGEEVEFTTDEIIKVE